jgi:hypothetical protein
MQNQKQELAEVVLQMAESYDPSLDQETDFDQALCDIHRSNLSHVHLEYHPELCHSLV